MGGLLTARALSTRLGLSLGLASFVVALQLLEAGAAALPLGWNGSFGTVPSKEEYRVTSLPKEPPGQTQQYAGYVPVDGVIEGTTADGFLFFWLHESRGSPKTDPLVIWLNGGPGCSSLLGMFFENGPFMMDRGSDGGLYENEWGWNRANNLMFVEQPVETGYAFSKGHKLVDDERHLGRDFYGFLRNFYKVFPEYQKRELFIVGESYAGMYCPAIAHEVMLQNRVATKSEELVHLKGIAIGNGWVDTFIQTASYASYAFSHGMIDKEGKDWVDEEWRACLAEVEAKKDAGQGDIDKCDIMEKTLNLAGEPNEYDTRTFDGYPYIDDPETPFSAYLNDPDVQTALHVTGTWTGLPKGRSWTECNDNIVMAKDRPLSMVPVISKLVEGGMRVLIYNGAADFNCNFLGSEAYLNAMEWKGQTEWLATTRSLWKVGTSVAGYVKAVDNLAFVVVLNSGHLVPMDQPEAGWDLVYRFTRGLPFADTALSAPYLHVRSEAVRTSVPPGSDGQGSAAWGLWVGALLAALGGSMIVLAAAVAYRRVSSRRHAYRAVGSPTAGHGNGAAGSGSLQI